MVSRVLNGMLLRVLRFGAWLVAAPYFGSRGGAEGSGVSFVLEARLGSWIEVKSGALASPSDCASVSLPFRVIYFRAENAEGAEGGFAACRCLRTRCSFVRGLCCLLLSLSQKLHVATHKEK